MTPEESRNNMVKRLLRTDADDEDIQWITVNGTHVPLKDGTAVGGPVKGQKFSKATSETTSHSGAETKPSHHANRSSEGSHRGSDSSKKASSNGLSKHESTVRNDPYAEFRNSDKPFHCDVTNDLNKFDDLARRYTMNNYRTAIHGVSRDAPNSKFKIGCYNIDYSTNMQTATGIMNNKVRDILNNGKFARDSVTVAKKTKELHDCFMNDIIPFLGDNQILSDNTWYFVKRKDGNFDRVLGVESATVKNMHVGKTNIVSPEGVANELTKYIMQMPSLSYWPVHALMGNNNAIYTPESFKEANVNIGVKESTKRDKGEQDWFKSDDLIGIIKKRARNSKHYNSEDEKEVADAFNKTLEVGDSFTFGNTYIYTKTGDNQYEISVNSLVSPGKKKHCINMLNGKTTYTGEEIFGTPNEGVNSRLSDYLTKLAGRHSTDDVTEYGNKIEKAFRVYTKNKTANSVDEYDRLKNDRLKNKDKD